MENSARRRLDRISTHLSHSHHALLRLRPALLNGGSSDSEADPVIIGGMVLDIHATPSLPPAPRTTTPGKVNYVLGGVARNVAECVSKLGTKPFMISVLGLDMAGKLLLEYWKSAKLSEEGILMQKHIKTAIVSNIFNHNGEVVAGVANAEAIENFLTPEWIEQFKRNIHSAPILMVDANLNIPALEASCQIAAAASIPVWFEPVSVAKSRRISSMAKYVDIASPNEDELIAMANVISGGNTFSYFPTERDNNTEKQPIKSLFQSLKPSIRVLLKSGIKILIVTLGSHGVFLCSKHRSSFLKIRHKRIRNDDSFLEVYKTMDAAFNHILLHNSANNPEDSPLLFAIHFPALPAAVTRLTGAGDCLVGGMISSICAGLDIMQSVAVGIAASKAAVEAEANVPNRFEPATIADDAKLVYCGAKVVCHEPLDRN